MGESDSSTHMDSAPAPTSMPGVSSNSKLRDSCHACARAKVRCPKQKPTCSRCEDRGTPCQYFFTRRPGRRRGTSKAPNPNNQAGVGNGHLNNDKTLLNASSILPTPTAQTPPDSNTFTMTPLNSGIAATHLSDSEGILDTSDVFSTLVLGDGMKSPWREDLGFEFSDLDFSMPPIDISLSPLHNSNMALDMNHAASFSGNASTTGTTSSAKSPLSSYSQILPPSKPPSVPPPGSQVSSCTCLAVALDLLKNLSLSGPADVEHQTQASVLLAENKHSIESVHNMMSCPSCSGDSVLFTTLSMIILKIIEKYAVAARTQPSRHLEHVEDQSRFSSLSYSVSPEEKIPERTAAQQVLGELHRVQRLANQLSSRLQRTTEGSLRKPGSFFEILGGYSDENGDSVMAALSPHTLGLVESDVRKSLRVLSADTIKGLRQQ